MSICRQSNWKKKVILENKNQIENTKINYLLNLSQKLYRFLKIVVIIFKIIIYIGTLLIILYIIGLFTIFIINPSLNLEYQGYKYWLPLLIGLSWLLVIMSPCCCGNSLVKYILLIIRHVKSYFSVIKSSTTLATPS